MKEAALRDLIAQDICKLKPGLTLLQKEQCIPNEHGTKSFIDLYANDEEGRHVLIELKRSNAAARQAIHEVNKYVEGVKLYFGAKDTEIHVIIASTEWRELQFPFSRFVTDATFSIEGIEIVVTEEDTNFEVKPIPPLPITLGRLIAPWHHVYWYKNRQSLENGLLSIQKAYSQKGIDDYIILSFYFKDQSTAEERRMAMREAVAKLVGVHETELNDLPEPPMYEYFAYVALQMLTKERCLQILSKNNTALYKALEFLPDMKEDEALCYLHGSVETLAPAPVNDFYEIGNPAKFSRFFEAENCIRINFIRHGIFDRNKLLRDADLYAELRGEDGLTGQKFKRIVKMSNHANVKIVKEDVFTALAANPVWRNHILRIIEEIQIEFPSSEIEIWVFNPCTGIFTIYFAATKENGLLYLPSYHIIVRCQNEVRLYYGALQANDSALSFTQLLNKYYYGDLWGLLLALSWGGMDERDSDIMEDLGAQYRTFRMDIPGNDHNFYILRDDKWRRCNPCTPWTLYEEYVDQNAALVRQIVQEISSHDMGAFFHS